MSGSGVYRLRQAKKSHKLDNTIGKAHPEVGQPKVNVNVGSGLAPKKSESIKGYVGNTPPPKGRALPVRGEHS